FDFSGIRVAVFEIDFGSQEVILAVDIAFVAGDDLQAIVSADHVQDVRLQPAAAPLGGGVASVIDGGLDLVQPQVNSVFPWRHSDDRGNVAADQKFAPLVQDGYGQRIDASPPAAPRTEKIAINPANTIAPLIMAG